MQMYVSKWNPNEMFQFLGGKIESEKKNDR